MKLLTVPEVAEILRVTPQWVYVLARSGVLPAVRVGRFVRIDPAGLRAWIEGGGAPTRHRRSGSAVAPRHCGSHAARQMEGARNNEIR